MPVAKRRCSHARPEPVSLDQYAADVLRLTGLTDFDEASILFRDRLPLPTTSQPPARPIGYGDLWSSDYDRGPGPLARRAFAWRLIKQYWRNGHFASKAAQFLLMYAFERQSRTDVIDGKPQVIVFWRLK